VVNRYTRKFRGIIVDENIPFTAVFTCNSAVFVNVAPRHIRIALRRKAPAKDGRGERWRQPVTATGASDTVSLVAETRGRAGLDAGKQRFVDLGEWAHAGARAVPLK
jgi:hypothetical protein